MICGSTNSSIKYSKRIEGIARKIRRATGIVVHTASSSFTSKILRQVSGDVVTIISIYKTNVAIRDSVIIA